MTARHVRRRLGLPWLIFVFSLASTFLRADEPPAPPPPSSQGGGGSSGGGAAAPAGSADNLLFTGSFVYNLPIEVPPGIAGMQPEISLQYNSSAGNGWVGVGWDLSLGSIQRSTKNGTPNYSSADTFVFSAKGQAQELVKIPDGTYRSKIEGAFQKFMRDTNLNQWIVYDKSGTRFYFGQTAASQVNHT